MYNEARKSNKSKQPPTPGSALRRLQASAGYFTELTQWLKDAVQAWLSSKNQTGESGARICLRTDNDLIKKSICLKIFAANQQFHCLPIKSTIKNNFLDHFVWEVSFLNT